jgi:hypothetical protein
MGSADHVGIMPLEKHGKIILKLIFNRCEAVNWFELSQNSVK